MVIKFEENPRSEIDYKYLNMSLIINLNIIGLCRSLCIFNGCIQNQFCNNLCEIRILTMLNYCQWTHTCTPVYIGSSLARSTMTQQG